MAAPSTALNGENFMIFIQLFHQYGGAYSFGDLADGHLISLPSLYGGERTSFPGSILPSDIVHSKSVVGIKDSDSDVVIRYQVDECTCIWLAECFVAQ